MEPTELFNHLESNQPQIVDDAKKKLHQTFNITKESWLLNGLFDYYLNTNSARAIEILVSVREPHDKYLFDRLCESLKNSSSKLQGLTVLGHVLRRQPAWLYKITHHQLLKDLLKLLKTETDILPLLSALLVIVVLLPMIPALIGPFLPDVFDIFSRLAAWNCNPGKLAEEQLVHLQVAMYALFLRLYGMYPCHFLSYLRTHYRQGDNMPVFIHTVKPMLGTVKIHPHLVTASKDNETETVRWKKMGHHDIIVECERFAVEMSGVRDDSCYMGLTTSFRSRSSTISTAVDHSSDGQSLKFATLSSSAATGASTPSVAVATTDKDFWSPTVYFQGQHSPPPLPEVCAPPLASVSVPQTPNFVVGAVFQHQEGTSPPEAAIEATPETTPIKDPRLLIGGTVRASQPPLATNVVRALGTFNSNKWSGLGASSSSTPSHSQPSSPMRKEPSPFRFPTDNSAFEVSAASSSTTLRKETVQASNSASQLKLFRIMQDRTQVNESPVRSRSSQMPTSPLKIIPRYYDGSVPNSPVPLVDGPGAREWFVARPRPQKNGVPVASSSVMMMMMTEQQNSSSQEDEEVVEIVGHGQMETNVTRPQFCDSVLQEFTPQLDEIEYEVTSSGECGGGGGESHDVHQGSPCTSGGLHMPNSVSLQAFASRVQRLRYYSQCGPVHDHSESSAGSSPGQNISLQSTAKVRRANSCPEMKKNFGVQHTSEPLLVNKSLDESDEFNEATLNLQQQQQQQHSLSNGVCLEQRPQQSVSTQTLDLWPMPYEHLFLGIFPLLEMNAEVKPSPSPSPSAFVTGDKFNKFTPHEMLDKFIEQASYSYEHDGKRNKVQSLESEIKSLREQLGLVHLNLQYERHRREIHAMRNRRLLGESRHNKALEEHNSALRDQVSLLQKEIEHLNDELNTKKDGFNSRERELHENTNYWHEQCLTLEELNRTLRLESESIQREFKSYVEKATKITQQHQNAEAELFRLETDLKMAQEQALHGERLRLELEHMQREFLLLGELNQKFEERLAQWPLLEHRHEAAHHLADAYHDEIRAVQQQLTVRNAMVESQKTHVQELERSSQLHDELCTKQKRALETVKDEYQEQLRAVESKYETQRAINRSMEERLLELWQRVEGLNRSNRTVHSPDTSSCHEAAAGGGGAVAAGLSPHSSPLSASLASSEGSMAFLHTQQQQQQQQQDVREIKNLQVIVDQSESYVKPRPSMSEETTPDGGNPCFSQRHSD